MREIQSNSLIDISGGTVVMPISEKTMNDYIKPAISNIPAVLNYGLAAKSLMMGGPFSAPAQIWLIYTVLYYNDQRAPIGTTLDSNYQQVPAEL